ncbi:hypothetical protein PENTCL1PPCAC_27513, partial [Pristionchus entomophagus]
SAEMDDSFFEEDGGGKNEMKRKNSPIDSGGDGEIMEKPKAKKMKGTGKFMYGKWDSQDEEEENRIEKNKVKKEEKNEKEEESEEGLAIE